MNQAELNEKKEQFKALVNALQDLSAAMHNVHLESARAGARIEDFISALNALPNEDKEDG
jgi:uncharacterized protein YoxC